VPDELFPKKHTDVIGAVADAYNLKQADLKAWGRSSRPVEEARRVTYALLRSECWLTWRAVAQVMGRDTSGAGWIMTSARKANPAAVTEIRARLRNGLQGRLWTGDR
jgi:chromosomal replication initiation ATPase DnaA